MLAGRDYTIDAVGRGELRLKAMAASRQAAAAVLNPPYSFAAEDMGLHSLGNTVDLLGPYQASGAFVMRPWALANRPALERYLAAYVLSLRWVLDPGNRDRCIELLADRLELTTSIATRSYAALVDPRHGFAPDAALDPVGLDNTLALRREIVHAGRSGAGPDATLLGRSGASPDATVGRSAGGRRSSDYVELSFYAAALKLAGSGATAS